MLGFNGNTDVHASGFVGDIMYMAYDYQVYENDADDYDTLTADEGNIFTSYNCTNAKRHVRTNLRRKVNAGVGGLFNGGYWVSHSTYNDIYRQTHSSCLCDMCVDYVVFLRKIVI